MSTVKRSLRARPGSDLGRCQVCRQPDQLAELLLCSYCGQQFHPLACLQLAEPTLRLIRAKAPPEEADDLGQADRPFDSVAVTEDALHQCYDSNLWYCAHCKLCYICKSRTRLTRSKADSATDLQICVGCDQGFHRFCIKAQSSLHTLKQVDKMRRCIQCLEADEESSVAKSPVVSPSVSPAANRHKQNGTRTAADADRAARHCTTEVIPVTPVKLGRRNADGTPSKMGKPEPNVLSGRSAVDWSNVKPDPNDGRVKVKERKVKIKSEEKTSAKGEEKTEEKLKVKRSPLKAEDGGRPVKKSSEKKVSVSPTRYWLAEAQLEENHTHSIKSNSADESADDADDGDEQPDAAHRRMARKRPGRSKRRRLTNNSAGRSRKVCLDSSAGEEAEEPDDRLSLDSDARLRCMVPGCDSQGNLSGKDDTHYTTATCPLFHNMTFKHCQERHRKRSHRSSHSPDHPNSPGSANAKHRSPTKRAAKLNQASAVKLDPMMQNGKPEAASRQNGRLDSPKVNGKHQAEKCNRQKTGKRPANGDHDSPDASPSKSRRQPTAKSPKKRQSAEPNADLIEQRKQDLMQTQSPSTPIKINTAREPNLKGLTPIFDYEMFREAQCRAAELIQLELKQSPTPSPSKLKRLGGLGQIQMGKYEMDVWYSSPYPEEFLTLPRLYVCEFCLKYFNSPIILGRHVHKCQLKCPPGNEIYRKGCVSFFEIDGEKNKYYCQNLCLLAKLFLDHKTLYYDVEPFMFYIMTQCDQDGFHIVGYFSKEKNSFLNYNVSCILTLPPYQKQGFGRMLIDFSYLLTKVEGKVGSPEKPLSDLGLISYRSYWKNVILEYLCGYAGTEISIKDLSQETAINAYDIVSTLQELGMLKYWKGRHLVLKKKEILEEFKQKLKRKKNPKSIDRTCLHWHPATAAAGP